MEATAKYKISYVNLRLYGDVVERLWILEYTTVTTVKHFIMTVL